MSHQPSSVIPGREPGEASVETHPGTVLAGAGPRDPAPRRRRGRLRAAWRARTGPAEVLRDAGMATAEYAIVTLAAAGFGGLLIVLLRSDEVRGLLAGLVRSALTP